MSAIPARFGGHCGVCRTSIEQGEPIVSVDDRWVHEECEERAIDLDEPVCPSCWLVRTCECEES